jgi:rhodanese-related sulfurtransferase
MRIVSILFVALALTACGGSSSSSSAASGSESASTATGGEQAAAFTQISVDEVAAGLERGDGSIAVFDANGRDTFAEHHVPTATWVDYDAVTAEQLPADRATQLVFYCANEQCSASHVAAETASGLGYSRVSVMGAGIQGWIAAGRPVEAETPATE